MTRMIRSMHERLDEEGLIQQALQGDLTAFDRLVRETLPRVYSFLFRMLGNHEDAEDLAQESMVRAYRSLSQFRGDCAFSSWVIGIAQHLGRDYFRACARRPALMPLEQELPQSVRSKLDGPPEALRRAEIQFRLQAAIQHLPCRLRAPFVLRVMEGLEYGEVAAATGVSEGTARVQVSKARQLLMRWIGPFLGEERS